MIASSSHAQDPAAPLDVDQGGNDAEEGSDVEEDHDCLMPLEPDAEREEVEQAVRVDLGERLAEELASAGPRLGPEGSLGPIHTASVLTHGGADLPRLCLRD